MPTQPSLLPPASPPPDPALESRRAAARARLADLLKDPYPA